jgi:glycosyltransferase involved in cell wall biosynthesis
MTAFAAKISQSDPASPLTVCVVVPAHQAADEIVACLEGIVGAGFDREDILVVDDGSRDGTGEKAAAFGVRVIRNERPLRPALARNRGVAETEGDIIVFVDADVVIHPGAADRITGVFAAEPGLVALFGSYDDAPARQTRVSRYRNLLHHHVHQQSGGDATTFWTGFGAVRRDAFAAAGGFRPEWENIEDVDLGRIVLLPDLLCKHLKEWTLPGMFRTDLFGRAVPWTRLIASGRTGMGNLNLSLSHRVSAAMVPLFAAGIVLSVLAPAFLWLSAVALAVFLAANARFLALLGRKGGLSLLLAGIPLHAVHYVAGLLGYLKVRLTERPGRSPQRP